MDRRVEAADPDQVVEVVDVVRVEVCLAVASEVRVVNADLLEVPLGTTPVSWSTLLAETMPQVV